MKRDLKKPELMNKKPKKNLKEQHDTSFLHKRLFTLHEAAEYSALSYWTIREYVNRGMLSYIRLPSSTSERGNLRRILIDKRDLDEFIDSFRVKASR